MKAGTNPFEPRRHFVLAIATDVSLNNDGRNEGR